MTACNSKKYVTYLGVFDAAKTNYDTEFKQWYDVTTNNGVDLKIVADKSGCTGFHFVTTGPSA